MQHHLKISRARNLISLASTILPASLPQLSTPYMLPHLTTSSQPHLSTSSDLPHFSTSFGLINTPSTLSMQHTRRLQVQPCLNFRVSIPDLKTSTYTKPTTRPQDQTSRPVLKFCSTDCDSSLVAAPVQGRVVNQSRSFSNCNCKT